MKKIFYSILGVVFITTNLFSWEINLKPPMDSSGRIAYGITCNNGDRVIVTYNSNQSYKPYFVNDHTFDSLNSAASYACGE